MIRLLYLTHRWVGVVLALFMLLWFSSGLIIASSGSLLTTAEQRLAREEPLNPQPGWLSLGEALSRSAEARMSQPLGEASELAMGGEHNRAQHHRARNEKSMVDARLVRIDGDPFWRVEDDTGNRFAISALDGSLRQFSIESASHIAEQWLASAPASDNQQSADSSKLSYVDSFDASAPLRNYGRYKPFHRFAVDDGHGTQLIVSGRTGEVLQAATGFERALYYTGNFVHLFKPLDLLGADQWRRDSLMWTGLFAFVAGLTGMIIGWLRWKPGFFGRPTYSKGRTQPYREFWVRYHFWAGLIGGTFAVLWAFSGTLSTNPGQIFSEATASSEELSLYCGDAWPVSALDWKPPVEANGSEKVVEFGLTHLGTKAQLLAYTSEGQRLAEPLPQAEPFNERAVLAASQRLAGEAQIVGQELLTDYDAYYYLNRRQGRFDKPLPVWRIDLADSGQSSLYIDPADGKLLAKFDSSRRAYRWLYTALHHWDFGWFRSRPLWNLWITTWVAFGLVLSLGSVVLGWRRLRRTFRVQASQPQLEESAAVALLNPGVATKS